MILQPRPKKRHGIPDIQGRAPNRPLPQPPPVRFHETFEALFVGMPEGPGGFLRISGAAKGQDLFVDWRDAQGAIHGDRVKAELAEISPDGRFRGRILKILARGEYPIPARLEKQAWGWRAIPVDARMGQVISVAPTDLAQEGDFVSIQLDPDPGQAQLKGKVLARLGKAGELQLENQLTAAMFHLRTEFSPAVLEELAPFPTRLPEDWLQGREDLRELMVVTVDPPTAKDFDDAISLEALPQNEGGGWILGVHIADVSHYVREGGPLDEEARLRGTSVYFPDACIPMLPERLSGELCSLMEGVDRLTLTAWILLGPGLDIQETRFSESVIRSRKRLTYDEVKEASLDRNPAKRLELGDEICTLLDQSIEISRNITRKRLERGALAIDTEEVEYLFDAEGRVVDARKYARHDAHKMIEEFMLLANEAVARHFTRNQLPTLYRIHDEPDSMKLAAFAEVARSLGFLGPKQLPTPEVLNAMLAKASGSPTEALINSLLVRSLKQAVYSPENIGHSGLALEDYLHFTSPIRRYPDLVVHRLLRKQFRKEKPPLGLHGQLLILGKQCSDAERRAMEAERENEKWKTCLLMKDKVGQSFEATLTGLSPKVLFVTLDAPFVEAGVPLAALGGRFEVDEARTKAQSNTLTLGIGTRLKVEITGVDEKLRRVSAWILEAQARDLQGKESLFVPTLARPAVLSESDLKEARRPGKAPRDPDLPGRPGSRRESGRPPKAFRETTRSKPPKGSVRGGGRRGR